MSLLLLIVALWFVLKIPAVQQWLGQKIASRISKQFNTKVSLDHISFSLFNRLELEGLLIEDQGRDTLLYAGKASVRITDWFFWKSTADLKYIGLDDALIKMQRSDSVWNYQFIANQFGGGGGGGGKKSIQFNLKHVVMNRLVFHKNDAWQGQNTRAVIKNAELRAENINFDNKIIKVNELLINSPEYYISNFPRRKPASPAAGIEPPANSAGTPVPDTSAGWQVNIKKIVVSKGRFGNDKFTARPKYDYFDGQHLLFTDVECLFTNLQWKGDTLRSGLSLSAREQSGLEVSSLTSLVSFFPNTLEFSKLLLKTPHSSIGDYLSFSFDDFDNDISDFIHKIRMAGRFNNTVVSSKDLAIFAPKLKSWERDFLLNGTVRGTVDNLSGSRLNVKAGATTLTGNLVLTGLPNVQETFIDLNNALLQTSYNDLLVFVPQLKTVKNIKLKELGAISYKGNFTGFVNDFVTYGTLSTGLGQVTADLNLKLIPGQAPAYSGKLNTTGFQLGRLLANRQLGNLGFNGKVSGTGFNLNTLKADIDGTVTSLQYGQYTYTNISANGRIAQKAFTGDITAADPHLNAGLTGRVDFGGRLPVFDLLAKIQNADLKALRLSGQDYRLAGTVQLKLTGSNLDNFDGIAGISEATVTKDGKRIPLNAVQLQSQTTAGIKTLTLTGSEFGGYVTGRFTYANLGNAFKLLFNRYYPNLIPPPAAFDNNQNFSFNLETKQVDELVALFNPNLRGFNGSQISGQINSQTKTAGFVAKIPFFGINKYEITDLALNGKGSFENLNITGKAGQLKAGDSLVFFNTDLSMLTANGQSDFTLSSSSDNTLNELNISGALISYADGISVTFNPSSFTVNKREWKMEKNGELILRKNVIDARDMRFTHGDQEIALRSEPDSVDNSYNLIADIKNINIADFTPLFITSNKMQGRLNGSITVNDPLQRPRISTNSVIDQFWLDNDSIGRVALTGFFDINKGLIDYTATSDNKKYNFNAAGNFRLKDSLTGEPFFYNKVKLNGTHVALAKRFLNTVFSDIDGNAVGELEIYGSPKKPYFTGFAEITDSLELTVGFTNVKYIAEKARINFRPGVIDFSNIRLHDTLGYRATVGRGEISHDGFFKNMGFDIDLKSDTLLLLNTNRAINKVFYGYAVGDARLRFKGNAANMRMDVDVANPVAAKIELVTGTQGRTLGKADFVEFRTLGREMDAVKKVTASNLTVNINVNANPKAEIKVILDELAGDNITATGNGNIDFTFKSSGDIALNGTFTVEQGKYDFSLQSWLRKPFAIQQGSTIKWQGDPYAADIDIDAEYVAKKVSLTDFRKDLFSLDNSGSTNSDLAVTAKLRGQLAKPDISFKIGYPANSTDTKSPLVENILKLLENDQNEINRQVAFLILFNRLMSYDPSRGSGGTVGFNTGVNTISGFIAAEATKYFNLLLVKIFGDGKLKADIDFNVYTPGGLTATAAATDSRIATNIKLSRSWFDERLTIYFTSNLDFGLSANQTGNVNFALLPNIQVEYKLKPNGQVVATVFHRQVLDILQADAERRRLSTGAGIIWRKEGETLGDLFGAKRRKTEPDTLKKKPLPPKE